MFDRIRLLFLISILFSLATAAQDIEVRGRFQTDSIKIGIIFPYSLSATYPKNETVLFPDSTFEFTPFEIHHKKFFPTKTTGSTSYDSVIYFLTSFEIDSIQQLSLPVFIVNQADCTAVYAKIDSIYLQQLVKQVPDSVSAEQLPLKINTAYQTVSWLMNYPLLLIIGGVLLVGLIVAWLVFGKRIKRYFILRRLNNEHFQFVQRFEDAVAQLQSSYNTKKAEATLLLWKSYMEKLDTSPYTKFTTKEIFQLVKDEKLAAALRQIDKTIYRESQGLEMNPLLELQQYTQKQFLNKLQEVRNG